MKPIVNFAGIKNGSFSGTVPITGFDFVEKRAEPYLIVVNLIPINAVRWMGNGSWLR